MIDERLILAIGRLERALSRIETLTQAAAPAPVPAAGPADPALAGRHDALRARTAEAIVRLDALLGDAA